MVILFFSFFFSVSDTILIAKSKFLQENSGRFYQFQNYLLKFRYKGPGLSSGKIITTKNARKKEFFSMFKYDVVYFKFRVLFNNSW